ncbi:hypothetical protein DFH09DRAFT_1316542 [Mycena vulgaris]|nr:hypothetical protein DFH09DRAFT_1316542 [Mycena vulgaris]
MASEASQIEIPEELNTGGVGPSQEDFVQANKDDWITIGASTCTDEPSTDSIPAPRRPGRPKGSKNKNKRPSNATPSAPKPLGRPPGTGYLQRARAMSGADNDPPKEKRPVGRPPKLSPAQGLAINVGKHTVIGMPAVIRSKHVSDAAELVNSSSLHPLFTQQPSISTQPIPENIAAPVNSHPPISITPVVPESILDDPSSILLPEDQDPDDDSVILNDGIGTGDDDEESDSEEEGDDPDPANSNHPHPRRTARQLPHWLQGQFNAKVNESKSRGSDGLPSLYRDHHTFWFPLDNPYFATREITVAHLRRENYTTPHFSSGTQLHLFPLHGFRAQTAKLVSRVVDISPAHVAVSIWTSASTSLHTDTTAPIVSIPSPGNAQ